MADLLIEFGCEDLPAGAIVPMANHFATHLHSVLSNADLAGDKPKTFATPRRIAALWPGVGERQPDQAVERRGPAVKAAYKDGEPTKALTGFLKSAGATLDDVSTIDTPKGAWVVVKQTQTGQSLADIVAGALPELIKNFPVPRRMRWADQSHEFLRPVNWLLAVHGDKVLPVTALGLTAGNVTYGHRFHAPDAITISSPARYITQLEEAYVVADFAERRGRIVEQVRREASALDGSAVMDEELVDEVTALVEWPVALAGRFDAEFLDIPKEALIQTMQENQRYFALLDTQGQLMPAFITVANIESSNPQTVIDGNERVIRPRFADTMFFWNQDKAKALQELSPELDAVLFQKQLGSVGDKVRRLKHLVRWVAPALGANADECVTAAGLCKCDLTSEIVKELPKMQGIAGRYYAARDGHNTAIASTMEEHYFPKQAGGTLPGNVTAQVVALADKTDTLVGIYGLGLKPTGAKDPFGLRRAALGLVRILIEGKQNIELDRLFDESAKTFGDKLPDVDGGEIMHYVMERLRSYALEQGYHSDVVDAVLAKQLVNPLDIAARFDAITEFRESPAAVSLSAASKRIGNILKKAGDTVPDSIDTALFVEPEERALHDALQAARPTIEAQFEARNYAHAMTDTASLREPVDRFFDGVMVMADDAGLRNNRLALLQQVKALCSYTAELSRLQPQEA